MTQLARQPMFRPTSRREFLVGGLLTGTALVVAPRISTGIRQAPNIRQAPKPGLTMAWWGEATRDKSFLYALSEFTKTYNISVTAAYSGYSDYFAKLDTEMAGGDAPDVFQLATPIDFGTETVLADLSPYIGKPLQIGNINAAALHSLLWNGKLYCVPQGLGAIAIYVNATMLEKVHASFPVQDTWTWDDFATLTTALSKESPKGVYGCVDVWAPGVAGNSIGGPLEVFVRQRGREMFTPDAQYEFTREDLSDWFAMWAQLRKVGAVTPPDITAAVDDSPDASVLISRKGYMNFDYTGVLDGLQAATPDELNLGLLPNGPAGSRPGQFVGAKNPLAVPKSSKNLAEAVELINYLVNSPTLDLDFGTENGVPSNERRTAVVSKHATGSTIRDLAYINAVDNHQTPFPGPLTLGSAEWWSTVMQNAHEEVAFGRETIAEAVDTVFSPASRTILKPLG